MTDDYKELLWHQDCFNVGVKIRDEARKDKKRRNGHEDNDKGWKEGGMDSGGLSHVMGRPGPGVIGEFNIRRSRREGRL